MILGHDPNLVTIKETPMINLDHPDVSSKKTLPHDRRGRLRRRCRARVEWLEDRTLLAGTAADVLAGIAIPIALGTPTTGTLAAGNTIFYQVNPTAEGELVAQVDGGGVAMRLSLLNGQDQVLMQSDGQSPTSADDLITVDIPAGTDYLEVENLGAASTYTLTTTLTPSSVPLQPIPISAVNDPDYAVNDPDALVAGDFTGDGRTDLATVNYESNDASVLLSNGDGTFGPPVTYPVGNGPNAIVAGDFTGNGRTDLAVTNSGDCTVSVLLGNGNGTFQEPPDNYTVGSYPDALVSGDFTGDGRTDLAVANSGDNDVSVLLGNGDGTFQTQPTTYPVGSAPTAFVAGDFTGDGRIDLAVANTGSDSVSVLLGNGDGTFRPQVTYAVGSAPNGIVAGDFTGDGRTDLAVANSGSNNVSVLLGNGDGTFQNQKTYTVGYQPSGIVSGDFNGDGRTDLAVANFGDNDVSVLLGNGDGTFQPQVTYPVGSGPGALVAGDFTGDGRTDLAVANTGSNDVSVLLGNGDGTFQPQVTYAVGSRPSAIVTGDFRGDGRTDLAIANDLSSDVSVLLGNGDGTFQNQVTYAVGSFPNALVTGDFTGDGRIDLAVANFLDNDVSVLLGNGDGTFQPQVTYAVGSAPIALAAGDFRGDGRTDLAVANAVSNDVSVLLGNGDGTFQPQVTYAVGSAPNALVAGDFTGDGRTDLAVANQGSDDVSVLLGNGDGTFQTQQTYAVGSAPEAVVAGDFTGDGRTDLATANYGDNDVSVLLGNGDGTFQPQVTYAVGTGPDALVAGDFTGDGRTDLAVANYGDNDVSVLLGNGDGTFQSQKTYPVGSVPVALVSGDFNGDGRTDLAIANLGSDDVSVLLGNGDGTFQTQVPNAVGNGPVSLVAGDFTDDGRTDLAVANYDDNDVSVLLGNGDGTFQPQVTYAVGTEPYALVTGDFNGDGRTDLGVANYGSNDISVLLGNGDGTFQPQKTYPVGTKPYALVTGDFNGDGKTDLAVANISSASDDVSVLLGNGDGTFQPQVTYAVGLAPVALVTGAFTGDGRTDLAVVNYGSDDVSVLLGNGDGTFQSQKTDNVGTEPYAIVAGDFTGDGRIDLAVANQGSDDVSVLLGNGDGTFGPQVTYAVGSGSAALVAGDFTGDGRTDLAVANFGIPSSGIPGDVTVLLGNGNGIFQPQPPYAVGYEPRPLVADDFTGDGRTDLAVANYGDNDVSVLLGNGDGTFAAPGSSVTTPQATPVVADLTGDGVDDVFVVNGAGDILWRRGRPQEPGTYAPPITINPGNPSRDIVAVDTDQGMVLASVDATDDAISLYAWRDGSFALIGSLPTGSLPAQIATADLTGDRSNDLVVRNAGDGTLSVYFNTANESGPFSPPVTLTVGPGASDVTLADVSGDGRTDIVVTYRATGEVGVLRNLGPGVFAPPVIYPAGSGLYAVTSAGGPATVTTLEATAGVAAGALTAGGPADLVAIDPGSNTFSVLSGLGGGRFANPVVLPTATPAIAVLVADLEGNGIPDTIVLSASGVTVYRGDGKGGFLPDPFTISAGPDPTGMTLADLSGDGKLDLLVGDAYGDLLVLLGNGDGTFQPYRSADQNVALAVLPNGSKTPDFIFADQKLDRVAVDYASGQTILTDRTNGLLAPGAVVLADLSGDGIDDLIVANSGSNNVLVYPGLGNGQFGPELNGGKGFFTGTNPVGITVANLNGRPDLVVANQGSNDVSILLNVATADGGFTFVPGPRLAGGDGPVATVVTNVPGGAFPDLLISDSGSNQVTMLPGVGNGFFVDSGPQVKTFTLPAGSDPVQVMVGRFLPRQGPEILTVNRGSNDVTVISDFTSITPVFNTFSTGGIEPVSAIAVTFTGEAEESLVVANSGDGLFTLLGGTDGLEVEQTQSNSGLPEPTALDFPTVSGNEVSFYATTAGVEAAFTLSFILPGIPPPGGPTGPGPTPEGSAQLVALSETSLALVGSLLVTVLPTPSATVAATTANQAEVNTSFDSVAPSQGQGLFAQFTSKESGGDEAIETEPEAPMGQGAPPWVRSVLGVDELFQQIRQENHDARFEDEGPAGTGKPVGDDLGDPLSLLFPSVPTPRANELAPGSSLTGRSPHVDRANTQAVDEAIGSLWAEQQTSSQPTCLESPEPASPAPLPVMSALDAADEPGPQFPEPVSVWEPLVLATTLVIHASPLAETLRDRRRSVESSTHP